MMLRYNRLVRQSMRIIERSPEHADRRLAAWVKLAHLAQDAATTLFRAHTSYYGLTDEGRDVIVDEFEERLGQWMVDCPMEIMNGKQSFLQTQQGRELMTESPTDGRIPFIHHTNVSDHGHLALIVSNLMKVPRSCFLPGNSHIKISRSDPRASHLSPRQTIPTTNITYSRRGRLAILASA